MNSMRKLLLGCITSLEKRHGISDVKFNPGSSVSKHELSQWELTNSCSLPEDLKSFYLTMDGFTLTWSTKVSEGVIPLGRMEINKLENLSRVQLSSNKEVVSVLDGLMDDDDDTTEVPRFDSRSRIFEFDHCDGYGKACLVYMNTKAGVPANECHIWFMDRSLSWHYMADNFLIYYRLMMAHLGLPQWQYAFTELGISPQIQQWFNVFAPLRLEMMADAESRPAALESGDTTSQTTAVPLITCHVDTQRIFKGKIDKKKTASVSAPAGQKKKPATTAVGKPALTSNAQRSSASSSQSLGSKLRS